MGADVEENPCETRVYKTWVSFLRLEFHHFNFFFLAFFWVLTQRSWSSSKLDSHLMDSPPWPSRTSPTKSPTSKSTWASASIRAAPRSCRRHCCASDAKWLQEREKDPSGSSSVLHHQIALPILLQVCCSSSTKIDEPRSP